MNISTEDGQKKTAKPQKQKPRRAVEKTQRHRARTVRTASRESDCSESCKNRQNQKSQKEERRTALGLGRKTKGSRQTKVRKHAQQTAQRLATQTHQKDAPKAFCRTTGKKSRRALAQTALQQENKVCTRQQQVGF